MTLQTILKKHNAYSVNNITPNYTIFGGPTLYNIKDSDSVVWTNGRLVVLDDPKIIEYFGDFLLKRLLKEGETYFLDVDKKNRIKVVKKLNYIPTEISKLVKLIEEVNNSETKETKELVKLLPSKEKKQSLDNKQFSLFTDGEEDPAFKDKKVRIDEDYFNYIKLIFPLSDMFMLKRETKFSPTLPLDNIRFYVDSKLRAMVAPHYILKDL